MLLKKEENKEQIASAYASIAELYMNPPLCDIENAENLCEQHLNKALKISPENIDALQNMANLRILRGKDDEAKKLLKKVVD